MKGPSVPPRCDDDGVYSCFASSSTTGVISVSFNTIEVSGSGNGSGNELRRRRWEQQQQNNRLKKLRIREGGDDDG